MNARAGKDYNLWALLALLFAVSSYLILNLAFLFVLPSVLCGHKALSVLKRGGGTQKGRGMAVIALIAAYPLLAGQLLQFYVLFAGPSSPPGGVNAKAVAGLTHEQIFASGPSAEAWGREALLPLIPADSDIGIVMGVLAAGKSHVYSFGDAGYNGDTLFEVGSVSKVITSMILAVMVTEGKVNLDDPVTKYLPNDVASGIHGTNIINLAHLATHSSGYPRMMKDISFWDSFVFALRGRNNPYEGYDVQALYESVRVTRPVALPGDNYLYSNFGVGLLGQLLSNAEGAAYDDILKKYVTGPLDMQDTSFVLSEVLNKRMAPPKLWRGGAAANWDMGALAGAGGVKSTANDMLILLGDVVEPEIESRKKAAELALKVHFDRKDQQKMGLGWHFDQFDGTPAWWHNGGTGGYAAFAGLCPEKGVGIVILGNANFAGALTDSGFKLLTCLIKSVGE